MFHIENDWHLALSDEMQKQYYQELMEFVEKEYIENQVFPPKEEVFQAFKSTPLHKVKVVIIGQDPYHNDNQAQGLCFSVRKGIDIPPSLVNIYKELESDMGYAIPEHGSLIAWAEQGVLLLNTVLTVRAHEANSHRKKGWEVFTDEVIRKINEVDRPIVFILWGKPAQLKKKMLTNPKHLILEAPHPSPLSSYRGFFGSKPFSQTNHFLEEQGIEPIDWKVY
ncbi:MAG: uracil-DNA glycosylase [Eubacteriales bacterium]